MDKWTNGQGEKTGLVTAFSTETIDNMKKQKGVSQEMQVTDIRVRKLFDDEGPLKAIVSVTLDGQIAIHDIKVVYAKERFFMVMPSKKTPEGSYRDVVHPTNAEFRGYLESAVIDAYDRAVEEAAETLTESEGNAI